MTVTQLNDTSVNVSWKALIIPDFPIESYTVVYSPVSDSDRRQDGEMTAVFPGSTTSGVTTDLEPAVIYQFQVFATIRVDDISLEGEWSEPTFNIGSECGQISLQHTTCYYIVDKGSSYARDNLIIPSVSIGLIFAVSLIAILFAVYICR